MKKASEVKHEPPCQITLTGRRNRAVAGHVGREAEAWHGSTQHLLAACPPSQLPGVGGAEAPVSGVGGLEPCPTPARGFLCPQCRCRPGFRLKDDGRTCADVDECSSTFPCSQRCINTHGSYKCLCVEGYAPRGGDPHSCKAVTGKMGTWRASDAWDSWGLGLWGHAPAGS